MIHADTIRTGSACTVWVAGAYWISSIRWLPNTTRPGVTATDLPGMNASVPAGRAPVSRRCQSPASRFAPLARLAPRCSVVALSASGLVQKKFAGDTV